MERMFKLDGEGFDGSGANFLKCMFLSGERFSRVQAAKSLAHISGAVVAVPLRGCLKSPEISTLKVRA
jgi:hypothetical protein